MRNGVDLQTYTARVETGQTRDGEASKESEVELRMPQALIVCACQHRPASGQKRRSIGG